MTEKELNDIIAETNEGETKFLVTLLDDFDHVAIAGTLKEIEIRCKEQGLSATLKTRLKTISVEILQNIYKHHTPVQEISTYFALRGYNDKVIIYSGNTIIRTSKDLIHERLTVYKELTKEDLKNFYRHSLGHTSISESGNAGIGLLDIVYRSGQQVEWSFDETNTEFCFFRMVVTVNIIEKQTE